MESVDSDKLVCHIDSLLDVIIIELSEVEPKGSVSFTDIQRDIMVLRQIQEKYKREYSV